MATLTTAGRNAACDGLVDALDVGTTQTYPYVLFENTGSTEVAKVELQGATAFGASATGTATATSPTDDTSAAGGTIDHVGLYDQNDQELITCTIGTTSSTDFEISSLTIGSGDTVGISSLTVTVPAS